MVRLSVYSPPAAASAALLLAHGAGAGQRSPFMIGAARALSDRGIAVATFDFPYMAEGRKIPDKAPILEETWRDAVAAWRAEHGGGQPIFIGGKSMGGRMASQAAARWDLQVAGLVFLGYPLHPPGKPGQRRDAHLPSIAAPMLFVQGTRDAFGTSAEIADLLPGLQNAALYEVADGDHSFKVPARAGGALDVMAGIYDRVAGFIAASAGKS